MCGEPAAMQLTAQQQDRLALHGGSPTRTAPWPEWPIWDVTEEEALLRVLRSGHWGRLTGPEATAFEHDFAQAHGARYAVALPCGTVALKLALLAAGIQAGDEVIDPPYTFVATVGAVLECNAVPVFADIHPDSYCLDPTRAAEAVTDKTRALIAVHLGGLPAEMDQLQALANQHRLVLIEDASHAPGSVYKGRPVGSLGDFACFSFQATKNLNSGEGGIVLTSDEAAYHRLRAQSDWGRLPLGWTGEPIVGANYRITELQAALLRAQWTRFPAQCARRDRNGKQLDTLLAEIPGLRPLPRTALGCDVNAYHLYVFRYDEAIWGMPRATFIDAMIAEGIPVQPGYTTPLYEWPAFARKQFGPYAASREGYADTQTHRAHCPVMERVSKHEGCWIKQSALLAEPEEMNDIAQAARKVWSQRNSLYA